MSVEFEPVKLGPRRRRVDPAVVGVVLVSLGLVLAVLKPWSPVADPVAVVPIAGSTPPPSASRSTLAAPSSAPAPLPSLQEPVNTASYATWARVRSAVEPHADWGIRAIVAAPSGMLATRGDLRFEEIWNRLADIATSEPTVDIEPNDRTVVAIGVTFPPAHTPLDTRVWLVDQDGLEWIDTEAIEPSPAGGGFLYRVMSADGSVQNWPAGRYRVDVLVDGGIRRFDFTLPNRFEVVPTDRSQPAATADLVDPMLTDTTGVGTGLFATSGGVAEGMPSVRGSPLTEAQAWLDIDPGTLGAPRAHVAAAYLPDATGLGVRLPTGSAVTTATIRRLAPSPLDVAPTFAIGPVDPGHPSDTVLFRAPAGRAWPAGSYELTVGWTDRTGAHEGSWHAELRPGPVRETAAMLQAARRFARFSGSSGLVTGTAEPLEGGPRAVAIRLTRPTAAASSVVARDRVPCDGMTVGELNAIVGLAGSFGTTGTRVRAQALFEYIRSDDLPVLVASGDVPGVVLVAPVGNAGATSDAFRQRLADSSLPTGGPVCLRTMPAG